METAVANLVKEGTRATVVVTGYFGDRLAQMCERYGATVTRLDVEWGSGLRSRRAARAAEGDAGRRRRDGARRNVHRRAEPGARAGGDRARARRADDRRRGHLARRACRSTSAAWGIDAVLQLHAEMPRRAVGAGAGRLRPARARAAREVPQLLFRSHAARGLLAAPQVSPHDVVDAGLRARTRRWRSSKKKGSSALGAARAQPSRAARRRSRALGLSRAAAAKASGCGR